MLSVEGQLPAEEMLCVEYPGLVRDTERALETLGGLQDIALAKRDESSVVPLRLRPDDPYSHPIFGEKLPTAALVLRIRRPRASDGGEPLAPATACAIARVTQRVVFRGLADFQYVVSGARKTLREELDCALQGGEVADPLEVPPSLFSPLDTVKDYTSVWAGKRLLLTAPRSKLTGAAKLVRTEFKLDGALTERLGPQSLSALSQRARDLHAQLVRLFDARPIWSRLKLDEKLNANASAPVPGALTIRVIPYVAYYFTTGPWSRCYVKHGYDPRASPDSRIYQSLDIRICKQSNRMDTSHLRASAAADNPMHVPRKSEPGQMAAPKRIRTRESQHGQRTRAAGADDAGADGDEHADDDGGAVAFPRQRQFTFQLCDLKIGALQEAVHALPEGGGLALTCDAKHGWYSESTLTQLRQQAKITFRGDATGDREGAAAAVAAASSRVRGRSKDGLQPAAKRVAGGKKRAGAPVVAVAQPQMSGLVLPIPILQAVSVEPGESFPFVATSAQPLRSRVVSAATAVAALDAAAHAAALFAPSRPALTQHGAGTRALALAAHAADRADGDGSEAEDSDAPLSDGDDDVEDPDDDLDDDEDDHDDHDDDGSEPEADAARAEAEESDDEAPGREQPRPKAAASAGLALQQSQAHAQAAALHVEFPSYDDTDIFGADDSDG